MPQQTQEDLALEDNKRMERLLENYRRNREAGGPINTILESKLKSPIRTDGVQLVAPPGHLDRIEQRRRDDLKPLPTYTVPKDIYHNFFSNSPLPSVEQNRSGDLLREIMESQQIRDAIMIEEATGGSLLDYLRRQSDIW